MYYYYCYYYFTERLLKDLSTRLLRFIESTAVWHFASPNNFIPSMDFTTHLIKTCIVQHRSNSVPPSYRLQTVRCIWLSIIFDSRLHPVQVCKIWDGCMPAFMLVIHCCATMVAHCTHRQSIHGRLAVTKLRSLPSIHDSLRCLAGCPVCLLNSAF